MLGRVVVPKVDLECLKRCPAIAMVRISRFQKPIGELVGAYHRIQDVWKIHTAWLLTTYHREQNYASRQTWVSIGNWSIGYKNPRRGAVLYTNVWTLCLAGRIIMHTVVNGPSAQATRRWQNLFLFTQNHIKICPKVQVCCTYHHLRGTHLHKRAGVRAGNFENDPYKIIKGTWVLSVWE